MRLAIDGAFDASLPQDVSVAPLRAWQRPTLIAFTVMTIAAVVTLVNWYARPAQGQRGVIRFTVPVGADLALETWESHNLALDPDGRRLAFVAVTDGVERLWLHSLDRDAAEPLAGTEGADSPFWSPDGRWLAFFTSTHLWKLRPGAGPPEIICPAEGQNSAAWGPDDKILFTQFFAESEGLFLVDAAGGTPRLIVANEFPGPMETRWPVFLPDGEQFLFVAFKSRDAEPGSVLYLYAGRLSEESVRLLFRFDSRVGVVPGHLVYVEQRTLLARPFDFQRLRFTGEAIPLGPGVPKTPIGSAPFAVSPAGVLAYGTRSDISRLIWRDRSGRELGTIGEPGLYESVTLSPDGSKLAFVTGDFAEQEIWIHDLERDIRSRLTSDHGLESNPVWSPDGSRIVYSRHGPKVERNGMYIRSVAGGDATWLGTPEGLTWANDWSRDGEWIAYTEHAGRSDLWLFPMTGDGPPVARLGTRFDEWGETFSPDGAWLAYGSDESGRSEVYVASATGTDGGMRVSTEGGGGAWWRGDGTELFYTSEEGVVAVPMQYREGELVPGRPEELFPAEGWLRGVTPDGERFLLNEPIEPGLTVRVVLNWTDVREESN